MDAYEPAANRIAVTVSVSFVEERERVIREQQESIQELSTPVLQVRERLLILPIIGVLDSQRARQLMEQLLAIRNNRAKVVVVDITGVATIDLTVANHLFHTVEASRLMGASVIVTGLSSKIAQTLVDLDVDLSMIRTAGDLQGGLEEAERVMGYSRRSRSPWRRNKPLSVLISRQGDYLIASVVSDLSDSQVVALRAELVDRVGELASRGSSSTSAAGRHRLVRGPVTSFHVPPRLRGAETVVVGIQPEVAIAMVQFDLDLDPIHSALDIDEAFLLSRMD